ncbi:hypothetical protein GCM10010149_47600 [Nonomuraea roseoviolacea subsp. roseoviolacea]|uniref:hypothetical protein n=1 Tax=Nonomuraea roseoviolacea TaxID=103837 RepID=UPI0031E4517C
MPEFSYPFDGGSGAAITEDQWSYMARGWQDNGVEAVGPASDALKVSSQGAPFTLIVQAGHANLEGFHYHLSEIKSLSITENTSQNSRIDRVVLRLDRSSNTIAMAIKEGVAAASPIPPSVDTSWNSPELSLATFTVRAGANTVLSSDVVDTRPFLGRRVRVANDLGQLPLGSIAYQPASDAWGLVKSGGTDRVATASELAPILATGGPALEAHKLDPDPHPTYLTNSRGDARYVKKSHTHKLTSQSFSVSAASGYTALFSSCAARAGVAFISVHLRRTSTSTAIVGETVGTVSASHKPDSSILLPAYVHSADRSTLTKAGAVQINSTTGAITTYETFVGTDERILIAGSYLVAPFEVYTGTEV